MIRSKRRIYIIESQGSQGLYLISLHKKGLNRGKNRSKSEWIKEVDEKKRIEAKN